MATLRLVLPDAALPAIAGALERAGHAPPVAPPDPAGPTRPVPERLPADTIRAALLAVIRQAVVEAEVAAHRGRAMQDAQAAAAAVLEGVPDA